MVDSVVFYTRKVLVDLLERQEGCDIIFHLKDQVVIKAHSYVLAAHSNKFDCENRDSALEFYMDPRIEHSDMWEVLKYMYIRESFDINILYKDSFILLAYFFHDSSLIMNADNILLNTISKSSAFDIFYYAIDMNMSYSCKDRIYEYINGNVFKWPTSYTLDMVLMQPNLLSIAENENKNIMDNVMEGAQDFPPIIPNNSEVGIPVSDTGEPYFEIDNTHSNIEEDVVNVVDSPKQDNLYEEIEEQLDVVGNPEFDPLFEQIEEQLHVFGNPEHDALFEQLEELLDVVGVYENEATASKSNMNGILYGNPGSDNDFV